MIAAGLLWLLAAGGLVFLVAAHRATLAHFTAARRPELGGTPSVSILKPIEGATDQTLEALRTFAHQDYPGEVELLVGTLSAEDPVVPLVAQVPGAELVLAEPLGANRKTSIMAALAARARGDILVFSDADVSVEPDYLRWIVGSLQADGVGLVTCLPRPTRLATVGGRLIALHYATVYLPQWMLARRAGGIRFAIGMTMALRRETLASIGGFGAFADALADDYQLGARVAARGLNVVVPPLLLATSMPTESAGAAWRRLLRWKRTIERCRPLDYVGTAFCHPVIWAVLAAALTPTWVVGWLLAALTMALRRLLAGRLLGAVPGLLEVRRALGWLPLLELAEWLTWWGAYLGRTVVWAGRRYRLTRSGDLVPLDPPRG